MKLQKACSPNARTKPFRLLYDDGVSRSTLMHDRIYLQLSYSFLSAPTPGNDPPNTSRTNAHRLSQREQEQTSTGLQRGCPQERFTPGPQGRGLWS